MALMYTAFSSSFCKPGALGLIVVLFFKPLFSNELGAVCSHMLRTTSLAPLFFSLSVVVSYEWRVFRYASACP